jgi:capsular exopolysaccharide synthesis family protein
MEFGQSVDILEDNNSENSNQDIKDIILKYLRHWKWFILSLVITLAFAFYKLNFIRPQYKANITIKIKDQNSSDNSTLSVFQDLGVVNGSNNKIEDEIEILKSRGLLGEVVKSLKLNVKIFTNKNVISKFLDDNLSFNTQFYENEKYKNTPLKINFFISDSALYKTNAEFIISINSPNSFTYIDSDKSIEKKYAFGEKMSTGFGELIIIPNTDLQKSNLIGTNVLIKIFSIKNLAKSYSNRLQIEPKSDFSNILSLSIRDAVRQRSEDFLSELVKKYNERAIFLKEQLSKSTSDFVTQRLEKISNELSDVDLKTESLKTRYGLSDAGSSTGLNMQSGQELEKQIVSKNTELQLIESVKEYVSQKDPDNPIPVNLGIGDNDVQSASTQYNELIMEKQRLLKNSTEKNPIVVNINEELKRLEDNIKLGLDNLSSSKQISIDALNKQDALINSRIYSAPQQERKIRDVQRQQGIKEQLYLYLLQKREETAITLGVIDPNAKIINTAESTPGPISPKKKIYYMAALLAGLLIPIIIIYIIDFLDTKVKSQEEIQRLLNIPVLGDIPKIDSKKKYLITKKDHSSVAEAFRILRTNLSFLLTHTNQDKGKTIFITSTIAHEGKSLVASNLAVSLAHAGKKTLLLGMDIRDPKIKSYLGLRGSKGVTNYIINKEISSKDITLKVPKAENLDLISSGDIAPNPAELLMSPRVKELFEEVKENYEYIIVDTAASSIITDTTLLRNYADAFIFVIRANYLEKKQLRYVKSVYKDKVFDNLAILVNDVDTEKGYGYGYGYGEDRGKSKKPWWKLT